MTDDSDSNLLRRTFFNVMGVIGVCVVGIVASSSGRAETDASIHATASRQPERLDEPQNGLSATFIHAPNALATWVEQLDSESFASRDQAAASLLAFGPEATDALRTGLRHSSLEVQTRSQRLIRQIHEQQVNVAVHQLLTTPGFVDTTTLPYWVQLRESLGDNFEARQLYASLVSRHQEALTALSGDTVCGYRLPPQERLDPLRMPSHDRGGWTLVLLSDVTRGISHPRVPSSQLHAQRSRLVQALAIEPTGPTLVGRPDARDQSSDELLGRMLRAWLQCRAGQSIDRQTLMIAMRYRCHESANQICESILNHPSSAPHSLSLALLASAALGHPELDHQLAKFASDRRVTHHWPLRENAGHLVQTRLQDIVVALRLHRQSIDPRSVGFEGLLADPTYIYREHSIGFSSEAARATSFEAAFKRLNR